MIRLVAFSFFFVFFFFQAEDGIRDHCVTGVQTCALPIWSRGSLSPLPLSTGGEGRGSRGTAIQGDFFESFNSLTRSEERRVGKECRSRWWAYHQKKK